MIASVRRWSERTERAAAFGPPLIEQLEALSNPRRPVHYDYYHAQVLCPPDDGVVVVDLDEAGLGDPAFDVAHFLVHLRRLGIRRTGDPKVYAEAETAFLSGYESVAPIPVVAEALTTFACFKLGCQALERGQDDVAAFAFSSLG